MPLSRHLQPSKECPTDTRREEVELLNEFALSNGMPESLKLAMKEHLELTFNVEQAGDEQVSEDT